ncbi:MAG: prepilin-type N-terminal cleavage/methylation domain-containing protein [Planctomycetota bacterium]
MHTPIVNFESDAPGGESKNQARCQDWRRAFSLFELLAVLVIIGLVSGMAITKFGHTAYQAGNAEGFARRLSLDISQARRRAIATGEDHYLQFYRTSGVVTSYALFRDAAGGDYQVDDVIAVPDGATVTTASDTLTFDFAGALATAGTSSVLRIDGAKFYWNVTLFHATGFASVDKLPQ